MIHICIKRITQYYSKTIEPLKKYKLSPKAASVPIQIYERQKLSKLYLQFEASPSDPLSMIKQRFIKKKKILSDRRFYMPNKKEYLLQLDSYLRQIEQKHEVQVIRDNYVRAKTIGQKIAFELQQQKLKFLYNLIYHDSYIILFSVVGILLLVVLEEFGFQIPEFMADKIA